MSYYPTVEITGEVVHETDYAYKFDDGEQVTWLPKSQCEWVPDPDILGTDNKVGIMVVPVWMAQTKGLV